MGLYSVHRLAQSYSEGEEIVVADAQLVDGALSTDASSQASKVTWRYRSLSPTAALFLLSIN